MTVSGARSSMRSNKFFTVTEAAELQLIVGVGQKKKRREDAPRCLPRFGRYAGSSLIVSSTYERIIY